MRENFYQGGETHFSGKESKNRCEKAERKKNSQHGFEEAAHFAGGDRAEAVNERLRLNHLAVNDCHLSTVDQIEESEKNKGQNRFQRKRESHVGISSLQVY